MNIMIKINVRDHREKPYSWQDKEALRKMRDYVKRGTFSSSQLVKMRSLYLGLTEIASDNETDAFKPKGGNKGIRTYTGLTKKALKEARKQLIQLGLVKVLEIYKEDGGKIGYIYILTDCDRDESLKESVIPKMKARSSSEGDYSITLDSIPNDSIPNDSGGSFRSKGSLEVKESKNNIYSDNTKEKIKEIFNHWVNKDNTISHRKLKKTYKKSISARLNDGFSVDEIKEAIDNYDHIIGSNDYFFNYDNWSLKEFLSRGEGEQLEKFLENPEGFKKNSKKEKNNRHEQEIMRKKTYR